MQILEVTPFGWRLGLDSPYWRKPVRPEYLQDNAFREQFDYRTVCYDIFLSADEKFAICVCPPFFNLLPLLEETVFTAARAGGGFWFPCKKNLIDLDRCSQLWVGLPPGKKDLLACHGKLGKFVTRVGANYCHLFAGKKALFTKQKNNPPEWIADWINLNQALHGIQAVLLFDNDSDAYSGQELLQHLAAKTSLDLLCLVQLPYPFGPGGGPGRPRLVEANEGRPLPWDSDFLNYGIPAMAYLRFLEQAAQVIVCDIDEIILAEDQGDLAAKLQASPAGILNVPGVWATALATPGARGKTLNGKSGASVFFQAPFQDDPMVAKKYAFAQRGVQRLDQLNVHNIWKASGEPMPADETSLLYRHFKQVSTDWKGESRLIKPPFDKTRHIFDCAFVKAMSRAVRKVRGYAYPLQEILAYARSIGACPRPEGSRPAPPYRDYDCSLCPYKA